MQASNVPSVMSTSTNCSNYMNTTTATANTPGMYYWHPQYMYMQPYMYPGSIPMPPTPAVVPAAALLPTVVPPAVVPPVGMPPTGVPPQNCYSAPPPQDRYTQQPRQRMPGPAPGRGRRPGRGRGPGRGPGHAMEQDNNRNYMPASPMAFLVDLQQKFITATLKCGIDVSGKLLSVDGCMNLKIRYVDQQNHLCMLLIPGKNILYIHETEI